MIYKAEDCELNYCSLIYMNSDNFDKFVCSNSLDEFMIHDKKLMSGITVKKFIFAVYNGSTIIRKDFM